MNKLKVFEMFSGYGGCLWGLKLAGIPYECVGHSEIDKWAVQCHDTNFPGIKNYGDCSKIISSELPDFDLLTGGFPCQDVSIAGNRDLSKGRTNLYLELLRIAKDKKPKYMLLENVKGLLSMGKRENKVSDLKLVDKVVRDIKNLGYGVCMKVLNSKEHGIPQNRERVWFVCKLGGWNFMEFQFPQKEKLKVFIEGILEPEVDKKYYLSRKQIDRLMSNPRKQGDVVIKGNVSGCLCAKDYKDGGKHIRVHSLQTRSINHPSMQKALREGKPLPGGYEPLSKTDGSVFCIDTGCSQAVQIADFRFDEGLRIRKDNCSPCLAASNRTDISNSVIVNIYDDYNSRFKKNGILGTITPNIGSKSKRNGQKIQIFDAYNHKFRGNICNFLTNPCHGTTKLKINESVWRRLTPKECFRLMGFLNDGIDLSGLSDTQCYKLAGNGWCIQTVSKILKKMFGDLI